MKNPLNPTLMWENATLKDLVFFQRGFDITKAEQSEGNIPVISSSGITSYHSKSMATGPGVIIGRKGTLGTVFYSETNYWPHDTTLWSKSIKKNNARFVYYFLKTLRLENYNVGNANPTLNRNHIHGLKIRIPQKSEQEKIADILSAYDDFIDTNSRRIQLLEESARLLFREWFVYFRFPGHEKACPVKSINSTGVKIVDGVPEGWNIGKIKDLGKIVTGKTPSKKDSRNYNGDVLFIKTPDMHQSTIILKTEGSLSETGASSQSNKYLPPWSILISCIGTVGVVAMNLFKSQTNQQINSVIPKNNIYRYYSFFCLSRLKPLLEAIGGGSTMANINKNKFENIKIIIPSKNVLAEFHQTIDSVFNQIALLSDQNQKLAQARDLLLPRLMSGAIEI